MAAAAFLRRSYLKFVLIAICVSYLFISIYIAYLFLYKQDGSGNSDAEKEFSSSTSRSEEAPINHREHGHTVVHIWGKAAIGLYLWEHILAGSLQSTNNGIVQTGNTTIDEIIFRFFTGPGVVHDAIATDVQHLVLVVNGRDEAKVQFAKSWLDLLPALRDLRGVAVMMLGNEGCENDWLLPYMRFRGGLVDVAFLVYDSPLVDDRIFYQWPLGVATYRKFPRLLPSMVDVESPRLYRCAFAGTVYPNSSRERLLHFLSEDANFAGCVVQPRYEWQPLETPKSLARYMQMLLDSEMTLSPVGINTECYRIYEALSCGSVPVVEDVITRGRCANDGPLRLLKKYGAPVQFLEDWSRDLPDILRKQSTLTEAEKVRQRRRIIDWYAQFLDSLRAKFVDVIKQRVLKWRVT